MSQYACSRCGHVSSTKCNLLKHLQRKTPCPPSEADIDVQSCIDSLTQQNYNEKTYDCEYCGKSFNTWQSKSRHHKICKMKQHEKSICIRVNAIGSEDITYLTSHPKFKEFMVRCIKGKLNGVCDYLVQKHFNDKHPENHNIRKLNKKDDFMELFDGRKWKIRYCDDILQDVFNNMSRDFSDFIEEALSEQGIIRKVWLDAFMEQVGKPLDWDFDGEAYEYSNEISDENREEIKRRIYRLACEYIYRHSKTAPKCPKP